MSLVAEYILGDFPCAIVKHESLGTLCGYIGVPPCHPWYGQDHDGIGRLHVHGGLTYHSHEQHGHPTQIAYLQHKADEMDKSSSNLPNFYRRNLDAAKEAKPGPGYPCDTGQDVWWLGFDCGHLGDLVPGPDNPPAESAHLYPLGGGEGSYKDEAYVRQEIEGLVRQAAEAQRQNGGDHGRTADTPR